MLRSLAPFPTGGFSALLSAALLLMVAGLIASDRALIHGAEARARIDVQQTSVALTPAVINAEQTRTAPADIARDSLVRWIVSNGPKERQAAALVAGTDTVLLVGDPAAIGTQPTSAARLNVPGPQTWTLVVAHSRVVEVLRKPLALERLLDAVRRHA